MFGLGVLFEGYGYGFRVCSLGLFGVVSRFPTGVLLGFYKGVERAAEGIRI